MKGKVKKEVWETKALERNEKEKRDYKKASEILSDHAKLNPEHPNSEKDLALSKVLLRESIELPSPRTRIEKEIDSQMEERTQQSPSKIEESLEQDNDFGL